MKKYIVASLFLLSSIGVYSQNYLFADSLLQYTTAVHLNLPYNSPVPQSAIDTITTLDCSGLGITDIADLAGFTMLKSVDLSYNQIEDVTILASLPNLRFIDLSHNRLTSIDVLAFPESDTLTVNISSNAISDFTLFSDNTVALFNIIGQNTQKKSFTETYFNALRLTPITNNCNKFNVVYDVWSNSTDSAFIHFGDSARSALKADGFTYSLLHEYTSLGEYPIKIKVGTDSIIKLASVDFIGNPSITLVNGLLRSNVLSGNQWYLNNTKLVGDTATTLIPAQVGLYKVVVTCKSGCISSSNELNIVDITTSINKLGNSHFVCSPNPAKSIVRITSKDDVQRIEICDLSGRVVRTETIDSRISTIDVQSLQNGVYIIKAYMGDRVEVQRLIKE